ncbi:MAG TPA: histidinol dehydrogenase [Myxococcota bacterium]|nr:histidinol dehydrogenase [Myxococcota bacterium]
MAAKASTSKKTATKTTASKSTATKTSSSKAGGKLMRVLSSDDASFADEWQAVCDRRVDSVLDVEQDVARIIAEVRAGGDEALLALVKKYDGATLAALEVTDREWDDACDKVDSADRAAIGKAAMRVPDTMSVYDAMEICKAEKAVLINVAPRRETLEELFVRVIGAAEAQTKGSAA